MSLSLHARRNFYWSESSFSDEEESVTVLVGDWIILIRYAYGWQSFELLMRNDL